MKKVLFFVGLLLLCLCVGSVSAMSGNGDADNPWIITTPSDLTALSGTGLAGYGANAYYELGADIDMSSVASFTPIGTSSVVFTGHFDGKNHTIKNLTITGTSKLGFFYSLSNDAKVSNIIFDTPTITASGGYIGVLSYYVIVSSNSLVSISNIKIIGARVSGVGAGIGGVIGSIEGIGNTTISGCGVYDSYIYDQYGVVGGMFGAVTNAYCSVFDSCVCRVYVQGSSNVGGVYGQCGNSGTVLYLDNVSVLSSIITSSHYNIGGIIGNNGGKITANDCSVTGCYIKSGSSIGGMVGISLNNCDITNCIVSKSTIVSTSTDGYCGGIYGKYSSIIPTVSDCIVSDCAVIGTTNVAGVGN